MSRTIRRGGVLPVLAAAHMLMAIPSPAQNRGVYPLGMSAINSGLMPDSAFTYSNQFLFYTRDQAKDNEGHTLPVTGNHLVILDMNSITWVSEAKILGARYAASASLPFSKNDLTSDLQGNHQRGQWICGLVLSARDLGLALEQGRGPCHVRLSSADWPIQRGGERQCRFRLLDPRSV